MAAPARQPGLSVPLWLPLVHIAAGILGLLSFSAWVLYAMPQMAGPYLRNSSTLIATHLFTLGFVTPVIMGAMYQLIPVVMDSAIPWPRLAVAVLVLYLAGLGCLLNGFYSISAPWLATGGTLLALSLYLFLINIGLGLGRAKLWNLSGSFLVASLASLAWLATWGVLLTFNWHYNFWPTGTPRQLLLHATLGLLGWFTLTICGVAYKLLPMFTLSHHRPDGLSNAVFGLLAGGTAGAALGIVVNLPDWVLGICLVAVLAGMVLFVWDTHRMLRSRHRKGLDVSVRAAITALMAFLIAGGAVAGTWLGLWPGLLADSAVTVAVVYLGALGWVGLMVIGQLYKIVPFLIWTAVYAPLAGTRKVPLLKEMYSERRANRVLVGLGAGIVLTAAGLALRLAPLGQGGALLVLAAAASFAWDMGRIYRHAVGEPPAEPPVSPHRAPPAWLPLLAFAAAIASLGLALAMIVGNPRALLLDYPRNHVTLVVTHLFTLGFGTTLAMGALFQLVPVLLDAEPAPVLPAGAQLALHLLGTAILLWGFWTVNWLWLTAGGTLLLGGAIWFVALLARVARRKRRPALQIYTVATALAALLAVIILGLTLVLNLQYGFIGAGLRRFLAAHLGLGLVGWFSLLTAGVAYKLVPMFAVSRPGRASPRAVHLLSLAGLAALLLVPALPPPWPARAATICLAAAGLWLAADLVGMVRRRRSRALEATTAWSGGAALALAVWSLGAAANFALVPEPLRRPAWDVAAVYWGAMGWIATVMFAQLLRIVPFVVWLDRFRRRRPNEQIPFLHQLVDRRLAGLLLPPWLGGAALTTAGFIAGSPLVLRAGALLHLIALAATTALLVRAALALRQPHLTSSASPIASGAAR